MCRAMGMSGYKLFANQSYNANPLLYRYYEI